MLRTLSFLCLLASVVALSVTAFRFADQLADATVQDHVPVAPPLSPRAQVVAEPAADALTLKPIFGTAQSGVTDAIAVPDPVPAPDYVLRGILAVDRMRWAVLDGPEGEVFVREGDVLDQATSVARIATDHVILDRAETTLTMAFPHQTSPQITAVTRTANIAQTTTAKPGPSPAPVTIRSVNMSQQEVFAMIREAEIRYAATPSR